MKILHVYAGPFPTVQGTQALVDATCELLNDAGHDVHLLVYGHPTGHCDRGYEIHRIPDWPRLRSTRSGPSFSKIALDLRLAVAVRRLSAQLAVDIVHAHHYEALVACRLADPLARRPLVFHCHALFGPELETYFPAMLRTPARLAGRAVDRLLPRLAHATGAVSPIAIETLTRICPDMPVSLLSPWIPPPLSAEPPKASACSDRIRAVYIGNLDAYQDLDLLLDGLEALPQDIARTLEVLIVTSSESTRFQRELVRRGLHSLVNIVPHGTAAQAHELLVTADLALVPRTTAAGVPIKVVNALCAGVPVLADRCAAGWLGSDAGMRLVDMRSSDDVSQALCDLVRNRELRDALARAGKRQAQSRLSKASTLQAIAELYDLAQRRSAGPRFPR